MAVSKAGVANQTGLKVLRTIFNSELVTTTPDKGVVFANAVDIDAVATTDAVLLTALFGAATVFATRVGQALIFGNTWVVHAIKAHLRAVETHDRTIQTLGN